MATAGTPRAVGQILLNTVKVFIIGHTFIRYVGGISPTEGISMMPTMPSDYLKRPYIMYSSLHRRGRGIKVGDVIVFKHPIIGHGSYGCKRVIGMPGDFVSVVTPGRDNGDELTTDKENKWALIKEQVIQVPEGHCWVAGDNLEWSRDSRMFGPVPLGLVQSKVLAVVSPRSHMKWLGAERDVKDAQDIGD